MSIELEKTATADSRVAPVVGDELPAGMRLGHFQLVKKLGAGGMGEVYLATDLSEHVARAPGQLRTPPAAEVLNR